MLSKAFLAQDLVELSLTTELICFSISFYSCARMVGISAIIGFQSSRFSAVLRKSGFLVALDEDALFRLWSLCEFVSSPIPPAINSSRQKNSLEIDFPVNMLEFRNRLIPQDSFETSINDPGSVKSVIKIPKIVISKRLTWIDTSFLL